MESLKDRMSSLLMNRNTMISMDRSTNNERIYNISAVTGNMVIHPSNIVRFGNGQLLRFPNGTYADIEALYEKNKELYKERIVTNYF